MAIQNQKQITTLTIIENCSLGANNHLIRLRTHDESPLPPMHAGQFVQVMPPGGVTLLRRPISICYMTSDFHELWLLVARVGRGTNAIVNSLKGDLLDIILPLGNTFEVNGVSRPLLIGGGVGIAPMLMLAKTFSDLGVHPDILLGGRSKEHIILRDQFEAFGSVYLTTNDGSMGVHGYVTDHPIMRTVAHDQIYCCGPHPMMQAVAKIAIARNQKCQVSLENTMACGIGACLCCVQDTISEGHVCVCTEGPVFDANDIKWSQH